MIAVGNVAIILRIISKRLSEVIESYRFKRYVIIFDVTARCAIFLNVNLHSMQSTAKYFKYISLFEQPSFFNFFLLLTQTQRKLFCNTICNQELSRSKINALQGFT